MRTPCVYIHIVTAVHVHHTVHLLLADQLSCIVNVNVVQILSNFYFFRICVAYVIHCNQIMEQFMQIVNRQISKQLNGILCEKNIPMRMKYCGTM